MEQLRIIFSRLRVEGLKYNAPKCSFGLNYIPYLGYAITREGIKTDPMKSQGIMDLGQPTITTELQELKGMVQYYRNMWPSRSHVLAPLIEAASGPKGGKLLWNGAVEISF